MIETSAWQPSFLFPRTRRSQNVRQFDLSLLPSFSGLLAGWVRRKEALELLLQCTALEAVQTSDVLSRWTGTTWPSGQAGATLEGRLACFAQRTRGPSRCLDNRLPGLLLSACLMSLQTPLPGLACSAAPLAQSSPKHTHSTTGPFTHWPTDVRPSYTLSLVKIQSEICRPDPPQ